MKYRPASMIPFLAAAALAATTPQPGDSALPAVLQLNEIMALYGPVEFDHENHAGIADGCRSCHHAKFGDPLSCGHCHSNYVERRDFGHDVHEEAMDCLSCHQVTSTAEMRCSACHKTPHDPENLHVIGLKGAFHLRCMGCHEELGLDVSCTACHSPRQR
jgi:hypothetical protein